MENCVVLVLAAGEGKRMHSEKCKVLHEILGKPMLQYVIDASKKMSAGAVCIVTGHHGEQVQQATVGQNLVFALQKEQKGTGHAVMQAASSIDPQKDVLVLYGDTPLVTPATLTKLVKLHQQEHHAATAISAIVENPNGYGRILRDSQGLFCKNIEDRDASPEEKTIKEINTGIYCFQGAALLEALQQLGNHNTQGEYYLPDVLSILRNSGKPVGILTAENPDEFLGVNSRLQLAEVTALMNHRIRTSLMESGVTLIDPAQCYIGPDVTIGEDTVIYPGAFIEGTTSIGKGCIIGPGCRLQNMSIGEYSALQYTTALDSVIGSNTTIGPYAYIRPNCTIGNHIKIGDFVEVKNSAIGDGTKVPHLTYVGDSDLGKKINLGCGTVTVNYDGAHKFRTTIEDNAFIGCNTNLVAPVTVHEGAYIAAGSTITKDVPPNQLGVARARQQNIDGWKKHS